MVLVLRLWNDWEVQILVVVSFLLQVFLLMFAGWRRRNISVVPRILLWLAYLLADSTALYILGHLSISSSKFSEHQQLMAFWGPCLLVHLGGQDTITAYSMEDSRLWARHLLSMIVQILGVAYVLIKYSSASSSTLVTAAAILMFVAGVVKYGERLLALWSSNLGNYRWFIDRTEMCRVLEARRAQAQLGGPYSPHVLWLWVDENGLGSEEVLQGAHDLFPIFLGQFVGYKFWPSRLQSKAIKLFYDKGRMYELVEMQLSLMYDILYTKAAVIHTKRGCFFRVVSMIATSTAFFLFLSSTGKSNFERVDVIVTYIILAGALLLEITTAFTAMCSTWTCAFLRRRRWDRLHSIALSLRRPVKAAERSRRWSGSKAPPSLARGAELAEMLLEKEDTMTETEVLLQVVFGVWVEMLCYAAHRCSRDSHARQLNGGIEFISVVWLLTSTMFNHFYCDEPWFNEGVEKFFKPPGHEEDIPYAP